MPRRLDIDDPMRTMPLTRIVAAFLHCLASSDYTDAAEANGKPDLEAASVRLTFKEVHRLAPDVMGDRVPLVRDEARGHRPARLRDFYTAMHDLAEGELSSVARVSRHARATYLTLQTPDFCDAEAWEEPERDAERLEFTAVDLPATARLRGFVSIVEVDDERSLELVRCNVCNERKPVDDVVHVHGEPTRRCLACNRSIVTAYRERKAAEALAAGVSA